VVRVDRTTPLLCPWPDRSHEACLPGPTSRHDRQNDRTSHARAVPISHPPMHTSHPLPPAPTRSSRRLDLARRRRRHADRRAFRRLEHLRARSTGALLASQIGPSPTARPDPDQRSDDPVPASASDRRASAEYRSRPPRAPATAPPGSGRTAGRGLTEIRSVPGTSDPRSRSRPADVERRAAATPRA